MKTSVLQSKFRPLTDLKRSNNCMNYTINEIHAKTLGNFPLGVDVGALSARIASLKGHPRGRHPYRRPLGWRLRQGYHTDRPT